MTRLTLATWNINSVRLRIDRVAAFIAREKPDIVCLQEIKCQEAEFPLKALIPRPSASTTMRAPWR